MALPIPHPGRKLAWLTLSLLAAGCSNNDASTADPLSRVPVSPRVNDIYRNSAPEVVRYDRYTLVSTRPADAQRDPLNQMVDIAMPAQMVRTVGDGFRYLLLESGYSLCSVSTSVFAELLSRPLPAVQRSIGPVRLSEALQILAGPAWRLRVDDVNREVCFTLRDAYRNFAPAPQPVVSAMAHNPPVISAPIRQSGNPFSASSDNVGPATPSALHPKIPTAVSAGTMLKPENVPVPSPVITTASNPKIKPAGAKPVVSVAKPKTTVPAVAAPTPHGIFAQAPSPAKAVVAKSAATSLTAVKPTTALLPAPSAWPTRPMPAPVSKPLFTPGTPVSAAPSGQLWRAEVGSTLKETLTRWAGDAKCDNGGNWVVIWPVALDYRIDAPLVFHGNFESVLVQVFDLYRHADKPLYAAASRLQCLVSVSDQPGSN